MARITSLQSQRTPSMEAKLGTWAGTKASILQGRFVWQVEELVDGDSLPEGDGNTLYLLTTDAGAATLATGPLPNGVFEGQEALLRVESTSSNTVTLPHGGGLENQGASARTVSPGNAVLYTWSSADRVWREISYQSDASTPVVTRITSQADFGTVVGGTITMTGQSYWLANNVVIEDDVTLVFDPVINGDVVVRADGRNTTLSGNVSSGGSLLRFPNQGEVANLRVVNQGSGDLIEFSSRTDPAAAGFQRFCLVDEADLSSPDDFSTSAAMIRVIGNGTAGFPPNLQIRNSNIGVFSSQGHVVFQDGETGVFDMEASLAPSRSGPSIFMASDFTGFILGASIVGGALGSVAGAPAITLEAGGVILFPGSGRLFYVQAVNWVGDTLGFTVADPSVIFSGNDGIQNSLFLGAGGFSANATQTVIATQGAFVTINDGGSMASNPEQSRFTRSGLEFTYDGLVDRDCLVTWSISVTSASGSPLVDCRVEVDTGSGFVAVPLSTFPQEATNRTNTFGSLARFAISPGDVVRLAIANRDNTVNILVSAMNVDIVAM